MSLKNIIWFVFFLFLISWGAVLLCQDFPPKEYRVEYFGTEDGLSSRVVYCSVMDTTGVLWSGTNSGLCRINGKGITVFDDVAQTFHGPMVRDENGWLYVRKAEVRDSIEVLNPATLEVWGTRFNDPSLGVFGGVTQQAGQALYVAQGSIVHTYSPKAGRKQVHLLKQEIREGDQLLAASTDGFVMYWQRSETVEEVIDGASVTFKLPTDEPPSSIYTDRNGFVWVSNSQGTFRKAPAEDFELFLDPLPEGGNINFFAEDEQGNMFFGYLDLPHLRIMYLEQVINGVRSSAQWLINDVEDRIITISGKDFSKGLRLNTHGGIYMLDFSEPEERPFRRFLYRELRPGKFGDVMRGFAADEEGTVYVNKNSKMPYWFRVDPETNTLDTLNMLKNDGSVVNHYGCGTNLLTYRGDIFGHSCDIDSTEAYLGFVYRYRPKDSTWKRWRLPERHHVVRWATNGRTEDELLLITEDNKDHLGGHLYYFYPAQDSFAIIRTQGLGSGIEGYTRKAIFDEQRNVLWIGTGRALYSFDARTDELRVHPLPNGRAISVSDIILDAAGRVILGTVRNGLQEFDPETGAFTKIGGCLLKKDQASIQEGFIPLPTEDVATINFTEDDRLLITTFKGLVLHDRKTGRTDLFTTKEGLSNDEFNTASTFYNPAEGRWYAGGINGFVSFAIDDLTASPSCYNPAMVGYQTLAREEDYEKEYHLPSSPTETITLGASVVYCAIDFTMPDYSRDGECWYQTKLEGLDPDWTNPTTSNSVRYTDLNPGTYTFKVRAYDKKGHQGQIDRSLQIVVLAPYYEQPWFRLLVVFLVFTALLGIHLARMAWLRDKMEGERKVQSLELKSLRQQLNPHFISNAMNAIKEYVQRPDAENPARYLTDFSLMMRRFLESSRHRFTSIAEEVEMLKRYVNLEQLRFPGKFDVVFNIDPALDPEMDEVPSLLLQPIIENAIEHGLRPLNFGGQLRVDFKLDQNDDDVILCTVSDNGVGRKIAALRSKSPGHISRATAILEERQALLASDDEIKLGVSVEDLHPDLEHTGTIVTIRIEAN